MAVVASIFSGLEGSSEVHPHSLGAPPIRPLPCARGLGVRPNRQRRSECACTGCSAEQLRSKTQQQRQSSLNLSLSSVDQTRRVESGGAAVASLLRALALRSPAPAPAHRACAQRTRHRSTHRPQRRALVPRRAVSPWRSCGKGDRG